MVEKIGQVARKRIDGQRKATPEVRDENFDPDRSCGLAQGFDHKGKMAGSPVGKIVPVDRCDDDMAKVHAHDGSGDPFRFPRVGGEGFSVVNVAEGTGPSTQISENHEGGRPLPEAFPDVGATCFFAYCVEAFTGKASTKGDHVRMQRRCYPEPGRFWTGKKSLVCVHL